MSTSSSRILPVLLLTAYLSWLGIVPPSARYSLTDAAAMTGVYLLLATAIWNGALLLAWWHPVGRLFGAYGVGGAILWQLREQTRFPEGLLATAAWALLPAALVWLLLAAARSGSPSGRWHRHASWCLAAVLLLGATVALCYHSSNVVRWHLLRHNTMIGTPAFYLLGEPVTARQEALFSERRQDRAPATEPARAPAGRPSVVFILLDTLRSDALAGFGGETSLMPELDRFLADGWRFTDVIANASWTRPTMGSFFTGLLPEAHGARDIGDALPSELRTLPEVYRSRGYQTVGFVTNSAAVGASVGFDQGFEGWVEFPQDPYARAELVCRRIEEWLETREDSRPLFLYVHLLDPHEPYLAGVEPDARRSEEYWKAYAAELAYLDRELAALLETIAENLPEAAVLVASDHGEEFFEHGLSGHGHSLYRELLDIPVGLRTLGDPRDIEDGAVTARLESRDFFDLLTALDDDFDVRAWAARRHREIRYASVYYTMEGRLLLRPYLRQIAMRAIETRNWKLAWSGYGDTWELYAAGQDPPETVNLFRRRPERVAELRSRMDSVVDVWRQSIPFTPSDEMRQQLRALGYVD